MLVFDHRIAMWLPAGGGGGGGRVPPPVGVFLKTPEIQKQDSLIFEKDHPLILYI